MIILFRIIIHWYLVNVLFFSLQCSINKLCENIYSPIGSRDVSVKNRHPDSETVICKGLYELYKRHVPVCKVKLKQLHLTPHNTLHPKREPVCLLSNSSYIDTLLNNSIFSTKFLMTWLPHMAGLWS